MTAGPAPEPTSGPDAADGGEIVARAGGYYRKARYVMVLVMIAAGAWFAYDGWVGYPEENRQYADVSTKLKTARDVGDTASEAKLLEQLKELKEHSGKDIALQRLLAVVCPLFGIAFLCWTFYRSRGAYRLAGDTLHVPGHPPIPLERIEALDKEKWQKKGIAFVEYKLDGMN